MTVPTDPQGAEENPIETFADANGYSTCLATFLDILGFRDKMAKSDGGKNCAKMLSDFRTHCNMVNHYGSLFKNSSAPGWKDCPMACHSESIADATLRARLVSNIERSHAYTILHEGVVISQIVNRCLNDGLLLRGAMDIGRMYYSGNKSAPLFGPAAVNAYLYETEAARFPRVIVSDQVSSWFERSKGQIENTKMRNALETIFSNMFSRDADGKMFLDHFSILMFLLRHGANSISWKELHDSLNAQRKIYDRVDLLDMRPKEREKFEWLRKYQNATVQKIEDKDWREICEQAKLPANAQKNQLLIS